MDGVAEEAVEDEVAADLVVAAAADSARVRRLLVAGFPRSE